MSLRYRSLIKTNPFVDAKLALSLQDLGLGATNVVKVRRSTDNVEQDFTATQITDGSLTTFCSAGDGFVTIWYNQRGFNNASQTTALNQPKIVNDGSLILDNGKPTIQFNGVNNFLDTGLSVAMQSVYWVGNFTSGDVYVIFGEANFNLPAIFFGNITGQLTNETLTFAKVISNFNKYLATDTLLFNSQHLFNINEINKKIILDGNSTNIISANTNLWNTYSLRIGANSNGFYCNGSLQEVIIFPSDKYLERPAIETNINSRYNIY